MAMAANGMEDGDGSISIPQEDPPPLGNRITTTADDHGQLNLVSLPDDVLELLFKMLPVADRGHLACTCSRLSDVVHWPSVWRDISIRLSVFATRFSYACSISEMDKAVIRKYSKFFRHVEITIPCELICRESFDLLAQLCERRVIRKVIVAAFDPCYISYTADLPMECTVLDDFQPTVQEFIELLESSTQISLTVNKLQLHIIHKVYPATVLEKIARQTENIFVIDQSCSEHCLCRLLIREFGLTADFMSIFPALQVLQLNIANLSDQVLLELSDTSGRRCQLKRLIIKDMNEVTRHYPQLSSAAWSRLTAASPSLQVECSVRQDGFGTVSNAIKPETPLVKLEAIFNTEINTDSILALCELCKQHSSTLHYFALSGGNSLRCQQAVDGLRSMLSACPKLYLSCNSDVDDQIIKDLSTDSRHWRRFHFTDNVHTWRRDYVL